MFAFVMASSFAAGRGFANFGLLANFRSARCCPTLRTYCRRLRGWWNRFRHQYPCQRRLESPGV